MITEAALCAALLGGAPPVDIELTPGTSAATVIEPLFEPSLRWVPGDVRQTTVTVRNGGPTTAPVRFAVGARGDPELAPHGALELDARVGDGGWRPVEWSTWSSAGALAPGESAPVDLRVTFDAASGNASQDRSVDLDLRWQAGGATPDPGDLPGTGSDIAAGWIIAGLVALAVGAAARRMKGERR